MNYQPPGNRLELHRKKSRVRPGFLGLLLALACLGLLVWAGAEYLPRLYQAAVSRFGSGAESGPEVVVIEPADEAPPPSPAALNKETLADIIGPRDFQADELYTFKIEDRNGHALYVRTTLDPELQSWAVDRLPEVNAPGAAVVALDPSTGDVAAMAGYSAEGMKENMALKSSFPAASLFKIVTAAAAVEGKKLTSDTEVAYDGGKYTLYKKNLDPDLDEGRHKVTLEEGFADSINTVFGKLGAFTLGREELKAFAERFGFNQPIPFEMPVQESTFLAPEEKDPYRLAELASGFNRTTKVSPLHGAMLAAAVVNDGTLMEPTVVREVFDLENRIYYRHKPHSLGRVVSRQTTAELLKLMRATVREGTGRRGFRDAGRHRVLRRLDLGGKSGTISNEQRQKVDWFVCFARPRKGGPALALSAVVVHGPKLGARSQVLVREAVLKYFTPLVEP